MTRGYMERKRGGCRRRCCSGREEGWGSGAFRYLVGPLKVVLLAGACKSGSWAQDPFLSLDLPQNCISYIIGTISFMHDTHLLRKNHPLPHQKPYWLSLI
jgi:hypothetical protein